MLSKSITDLWSKVAHKKFIDSDHKELEIPLSLFRSYIEKVLKEDDFKDLQVGNLKSYFAQLSKRFSVDITGNDDRKRVVAKHTQNTLETVIMARL